MPLKMPAARGFSEGKSRRDDGVIVRAENGRDKRYIRSGKEALGMKPDNNRPAGTRSATGVAQPMTGNGCGMGMKHLLPVMPFEQSGTLRQTAAASAEAATPGSPLGEPTCTLPMKSESVVVGYYALKKRVSPGAYLPQTN